MKVAKVTPLVGAGGRVHRPTGRRLRHRRSTGAGEPLQLLALDLGNALRLDLHPRDVIPAHLADALADSLAGREVATP